MMERQDLIQHLDENTKVLQDARIRQAFIDIDRADFLDPDYIPEAYEDYSLPIGFEQEIGKPTITAFMLELLELSEGHQVLEVGSGSGWTTSLLAHIVGEEGTVWGVEAIPELVTRADTNMLKYGFKNVTVTGLDEDGGLGKKQEFFYDRILVHAAATEIPEELLAQLAVGGIMVIPIGDTLVQVKKNDQDNIETRSFPGFHFSDLA